jgi:excisionase family DNA binding protein
MTEQINEKRRFVDVVGIAEYLGSSEHTIRFWVKNGRIPFSKLGRSVRFDLREIEAWLQTKKHPCLNWFHFFGCIMPPTEDMIKKMRNYRFLEEKS